MLIDAKLAEGLKSRADWEKADWEKADWEKADWEKSIKEAKFLFGLQCHLWRRRRRKF